MSAAAAGVRRVGGSGRRAGFTLVEVLVALAILATATLAFAAFGERFARASNAAALRSTASDLAVERLELIRSHTDYATLDGYAGTEATIAGAPGFARRTAVRRTLTPTADYRTVTVTVSHAALPTPVAKTTAIAAY